MKLGNSMACLLAASLLGCATSPGTSVNIPLVATAQNGGQIGSVTLTRWSENKTGFNFTISGAPSGVTLPLRLYTFVNKGSCQQPGPVAYAMNDQVNTDRQAIRGWTFSRGAPVALPVLLAGDYSVVVRTAADSGNVDIFCANIKQGGSSQ